MTKRVRLQDVNLDRFGLLDWPQPEDPRPDDLYTRCDFCGHAITPSEDPFCSVNCAVAFQAELNRGRRAA